MAAAAETNRGIVELPSRRSVDETLARLKALLEANVLTLFALVDHSGEARKVGLTMPATKLLIFGSPRAGTPLMLAAPSAAIDLPLKILVAANSEGQTIISYNSAEYLLARHGLPAQLAQNIAGPAALAEKAAG